jgi:hypothetical protein
MTVKHMAIRGAAAGPFSFRRNSSRWRHTGATWKLQIVPVRETRTVIRESIMRKTILTTLAVLSIGGATAGILVADAQPTQPPSAMESRPPWIGWMHRGQDRRPGDGMRRPRTFALIHPQQDRNLTPPDVQKIAEAFLLWRGNHTWKVVEVAPAADGGIGFALATQEGSVIARFTMDPHSARVTRTG